MVKKLVLLLLLLLFVAPLALGQSIDRETLRWMRDRPIIDSIVVVIQGDTSVISPGRVRSQMYSKERSLFGGIKGDRRTRLQRETYDRDTLEVKYLYLTQGYLGVQVDEIFLPMGVDSTALVRIHVVAGDRYFYGDMKVAGNFEGRFGPSFERIYRKFKNGNPVDLLALQQAVFNMKTVLANSGYPYALVNYELDTVTSPPVTPVTFHIESDSMVHFGEVSVEGSEKYPESVARREVTFRPGDVYRRKAILDSQRQLFESGYFSYIQLNQVKENGDRLRPDFLLRVRERPTRFVSIRTGAGQSEFKDLIWDFSLGGGKRNFLGSRRVSLTSEYSFSLSEEVRLITHRYRFRYTEPWFFGIRMPLTLTGTYEPPIRSTIQDYKITQWGVAVSTVRWFGDRIKTTAGIEYNQVKISDVPEEIEKALREEEGISIRRKIYYTYRRDSRDNIFIPRRGSLTDFSAELFGGFLGGDDDFYKIEASWGRYQVLWPGWISATRLKGGYVTAFGESVVVPTEERLYLGGASTIRGFKENTLGPLLEDGSAEGARITLIFNQEFRWKTLQILKIVPLAFVKQLPLWQSIFVDIGNGFRNNREIAIDNLAVSYGTGFQIVSPAGPIRIDYARRVKTEKYDFDSRWHFTILYAF